MKNENKPPLKKRKQQSKLLKALFEEFNKAVESCEKTIEQKRLKLQVK